MSQPIAKYRPKRSQIVASVKPLKKEGSFGALASAAEEGLLHYAPVPSDDGINGAQVIRGKNGEFLALFKSSEDARPHDDGDMAIDHGLTPQESAIREVAAHRLDRKGFFGVPLTGFVDISYSGFQTGEVITESPVVVRRRSGTLQEFINSDGSAEDVSFARFPTQSVHRLAILDIQLLNGDRHEGNVLVQRSPRGIEKLTPIDHGLVLPRTLDKCWFCWLTWPQAKLPFEGEELDYIKSIDIDKEVRHLRSVGIDELALYNFRLSSLLLKRGAESGLTAYDIGSMMCRVKGLNIPSELEQFLHQARSVTSRMVEAGDHHNGDSIVGEMLRCKAKNFMERRNKHSQYHLLRNNDDDQIAMSQYPSSQRALQRVGMDCSRAIRRASSPLSSPLMRI